MASIQSFHKAGSKQGVGFASSQRNESKRDTVTAARVVTSNSSFATIAFVSSLTTKIGLTLKYNRVKDVGPGSQAELTGVKKGWKVIKVKDENVDPRFDGNTTGSAQQMILQAQHKYYDFQVDFEKTKGGCLCTIT
ncbi:hypothetical protein AAMO2058_000646100 [Amorphochlora amoebiformis]|mmetsp:Transcript_964/g.1349  ORF Transcript_964/g.1349 Transcript_964/m.1349 type:complete len:136 (-) Transcript_964:326-733(-)